jgi:hypothetical protein
MEHYSLRQPAPTFPAPAGSRVIRVQAREAAGGWVAGHEVLRVIGIQPLVVHHYSKEQVASVHPDPALMQKDGWKYEHLEMRYSPVVITPQGKVAGLDPDDPRWCLVDPDLPDDRVEIVAEALKAQEVERQALERRIEEEEEVEREVEED